ncbi:MAG: hypothetical protein WA354_06255 [Terracidiphilus sp.]
MEEIPVVPRIIEALRMKDGIIITFENGKHANYPASLLYSMLPKAADMNGDLIDSESALHRTRPPKV